MILQKDLGFKPASYLASFILGRPSNGKIESLPTPQPQTSASKSI